MATNDRLPKILEILLEVDFESPSPICTVVLCFPHDNAVRPKNISELIPPARKIEFESCKQLKAR